MNADYPSFIASESTPATPENARFHVIPAPYEKSVSYGTGTAAGPSAILQASQQLEAFTEGCVPAEAGIYTHPPVDCSGSHEEALSRLRSVFDEALRRNAIPIILGGEHSVTNAALEALAAADQPVGVVQFDAHADLRDSYEGSKYSHACVMRRAHELGIPIAQIGVRSLSREEHELRQRDNIFHLDAADVAGINALQLPDDFPAQIYITFDVDALDPSIMPATGTPEPGGLGWYGASATLKKLCQDYAVIGFDVVELAPVSGLHYPDYTCARLIYNVMAYLNC